jgi:nucleoside-diphosphate-sugar epimerase
MLSVNTNSTIKLATWAQNNSVNQFVYFSTGTIYGSSPNLRSEEDNPRPDSFYGASKLASEILLGQFSDLMKIHVLRLYPVYGVNQINRYISKMISNIKNGIAVELQNGIGLTTTPLLVDDLIFITKLMIERPENFPMFINVSGNEIYTGKHLALEVGKVLNINPKFLDKDEQAKQFCGSNSLIKQLTYPFDFTPFKDGLVTTLR